MFAMLLTAHLMAPSEGITLGSDMSGGISDVYIHDCTFDGARNGFRIKSAMNAGRRDRTDSGGESEDAGCPLCIQFSAELVPEIQLLQDPGGLYRRDSGASENSQPVCAAGKRTANPA